MRLGSIAVLAGSLSLALSFAQAAAAQTSSAAQSAAFPDSSAISPEMVSAGRRIFHGQGTCFGCHGMNLEGGPIAPTLKGHAWKDAKGGELSAIYRIVTHGVPGTAMVAHPGGISDADAARVAAYVWSVGHRGEKP